MVREMFFWTAKLKTPNRDHYAAVCVGHKVYCLGKNDHDMMTWHVFNTLSLRWTTTGGGLWLPAMNPGCTAVLMEDLIYICGYNKGYRSYRNNMPCTFDVDTHTLFKPRVSGTIPEARWGHSACVLGKIMYVYGGYTPIRYLSLNDIYKLDTTTMVWSVINTRGTPPPVSSYHSATIIGTKMFVFGGQGDRYYNSNDTRVLDTETDNWLNPRNPSSAQLLPNQRRAHSAFAHNGELYIFGGRHHNRFFNDLWKFSPETFSWKRVKPKGKGPSEMSLTCCCKVGDRVILLGDDGAELNVLDMSPSLKTLCTLAVNRYSLDQSELPYNIRWELEAMTTA